MSELARSLMPGPGRGLASPQEDSSQAAKESGDELRTRRGPGAFLPQKAALKVRLAVCPSALRSDHVMIQFSCIHEYLTVEG